jgi:hypothetical protein
VPTGEIEGLARR